MKKRYKTEAWRIGARRRSSEYRARLLAKVKRIVVDHYGGKCAKCDVSDIDMLCVDHTDNNGKAHREAMKWGPNGGGFKIHRWLIDNDFPPGFQILCANHNLKKHIEYIRSRRAKQTSES